MNFKVCNFCAQSDLRHIWSGKDNVTGEKKKIYLRETLNFFKQCDDWYHRANYKTKLLKLFFSNPPFPGCSSPVYLSLLLSSGISSFLLVKYSTDVAQHSCINFRVSTPLYQQSIWVSPSEQKQRGTTGKGTSLCKKDHLRKIGP